MDFEYSDKVKALQGRLTAFMDEFIYPNEKTYREQVRAGTSRWQIPPIMEELKREAKAAGLWNLFLPESEYGAGLTNLEYAPLCEIMGRSPIAPEAFNCSAPDTGNMEVLVRYGTKEQQERWLKPLLAGEIRSCFAMTEPDVASSDATNIQARIERDGDEYVLNGRKWWTSGAGDPRCKIAIFMGKTNPDAPRHEQQSMILVPMDTPGVQVKRMLAVFGYDDAPHGHAEVLFENVRVPVANILWARGGASRSRRDASGRGASTTACARSASPSARWRRCRRACRSAWPSASRWREQGMIRREIADSRIEIEQARLLTLKAAHMMDTVGNKVARAEIAMIKVVAPNVALRVLDRAIQAHGGAGVSDDTFLAQAWAHVRTLRLADGPDEVHRADIARLELRKSATAQAERVAARVSGDSRLRGWGN